MYHKNTPWIVLGIYLFLCITLSSCTKEDINTSCGPVTLGEYTTSVESLEFPILLLRDNKAFVDGTMWWYAQNWQGDLFFRTWNEEDPNPSFILEWNCNDSLEHNGYTFILN